MEITDAERIAAESAMRDEAGQHPTAVRARYSGRLARAVVRLDNGLELMFPPSLAQGLENASAMELSIIEITPSGDGLRWPALDADLWVPGLLAGQFGSKLWMAAQLGARGGPKRRT